MVANLNKKLEEKKISLKFTNGAMNQIFEKGYSEEYGARPLRRFIEQNIEDNLAEEILMGNIKENSVVTVGYKEDKFTFKTANNE